MKDSAKKLEASTWTRNQSQTGRNGKWNVSRLVRLKKYYLIYLLNNKLILSRNILTLRIGGARGYLTPFSITLNIFKIGLKLRRGRYLPFSNNFLYGCWGWGAFALSRPILPFLPRPLLPRRLESIVGKIKTNKTSRVQFIFFFISSSNEENVTLEVTKK